MIKIEQNNKIKHIRFYIIFLLDCNVNDIILQIFNIIDSLSVEIVFIKIVFLFEFKIIRCYMSILCRTVNEITRQCMHIIVLKIQHDKL